MIAHFLSEMLMLINPRENSQNQQPAQNVMPYFMMEAGSGSMRPLMQIMKPAPPAIAYTITFLLDSLRWMDNFLKIHCEEIRRLIQHHAEHELTEHPLKRIIVIDNQDGAMLVTTTDTHLARGIGEAVHHAYHGDLKVDHVSGENLVRVHWSR
jgi:hypothetical protein